MSIKNRYNHTVNNPDATYNNNLNNIIPGLTQAFEREYHLNINQNINQNFDIPGYVRANDGKWYKYNYEINNIYYCPDNIIIDNFEVKKDYQEKEKYLIFDYFILDLVNKEIKLYDKSIKDSFTACNREISKIEIINKDNGKQINLIFKNRTGATIIIDNANQIKSYKNKYVTSIGDYFLNYNKGLTSIDLPNVTSIGNEFLYYNQLLTSINIPNATSIGNYFLRCNQVLTSIDLPNVTSIGNEFLRCNQVLTSINLPNVTSIDDYYFLSHNPKLANKIIQSINGGKTK